MVKNNMTETAIYAVAIFIFGITMLLIPGQGNWNNFDKLLNIATAFGTVGAVIAAVGIQNRQLARAQASEYQAALMYAAGMESLLLSALSVITRANAEIAFGINDGTGVPDSIRLNRARTSLLNALEAPALDHGHESISKLAPLPDKCAVRLYIFRSKLKSIAHEGGSGYYASRWDLLDVGTKISVLQRLSQQVTEATDYGMKVLESLQGIVAAEGLELSTEERYGYSVGDPEAFRDTD
ncbi:MAG: hypothetical protein IIA02_10755 [Proteobacteria bacterium]|nr:hypothetical protein [Pseudomonadota bacterium]